VQIFPTPNALNTALMIPWNWVTPDVLKKLEWWATRTRRKFDDIF